MSKSDAGKGDDPRPMFISKKEYDRKFGNITWNKDKKEQEKKDKSSD